MPELAIIGLGTVGGCRLPSVYREREIVLLSDWVFPSPGESEGDPAGIFFILTLLHEIAHATQQHKSPRLDKLSPEEADAQEKEADEIAVGWYNQHINKLNNKYLKESSCAEFRDIVKKFIELNTIMETEKGIWHQKNK